MDLDVKMQQIIDELLMHGISLDLARKEFEKKYITGAVRMSDGNIVRAARSLGIHRNTLRHKASLLKIRLPRERSAEQPSETRPRSH